MRRRHVLPAALLALFLAPLSYGQAWVEGTHYFAVVPAHPTDSPGKVEVTEVFSYGCPFCAQFSPYVDELKKSLPVNAKMVYLPASFNPSESWPMFQRAVCTAQSLGIFEKTHDAMFAAVWKTGELAISDPQTHQLKRPQPTIEDAARYYSHISSVSVSDFLKAAASFSVDMKMRADDVLVLKTYHVDSTPSLIINGKWRVSPTSAGGMPQMIEIAKWLVAKESH
jgi:protein dithiol oxidoreductase (disulfide-forming)